MKYAFVSFSTPDMTLKEMISIAKHYGYKGIELRCGVSHAHGVELGLSRQELDYVKQTLQHSGIPICGLGLSARLAIPETVRASIAEVKMYMDLASELNIAMVRVFGGIVPEDVTREEATACYVSALRELAEYGSLRSVCVALETHDDWSSPSLVADIMRQVNHPHAVVIWDVMHTQRSGGAAMPEAYSILKRWIRHVHFHDGLMSPGVPQFLPMGTGQFDHREVLRCLTEDRYDGFISGEWLHWEPYEIHLPREIKAMQRYEEEWS